MLDEMSLLYRLLSFKAQAMLDERTPDRQRYLVLSWVESVVQSQRGFNLEVLEQFEKRLSVKERDKLEKMSNDEYISTLKQWYLERRKARTSRQDLWEIEFEEMLDSSKK